MLAWEGPKLLSGRSLVEQAISRADRGETGEKKKGFREIL
jgi:hypothetical protein